MSANIQVFSFDKAPDVGSPVTFRGRGEDGKGGGALRYYRYPIDTGIADLNIGATYAYGEAGYYSPRHHHNFDQIRYILGGAMSIETTRNLDLLEGECGYFPEGTFYGPQDKKVDSIAFVIQFPGPNASYFMKENEVHEATQRLKEAGGVFENGVYRGKTADGRPSNKDGFEAVWEECTGQKVSYAEQRYNEGVHMRPSSYRWLPDRERPGLEVKHLGTFTEYQTSVAMWRLAPGAGLPSEVLSAPQIRYVAKGDIEYNGEQLRDHSCMYIPEDVATEPSFSSGGVELLVVSFPMYVRKTWEEARSRFLAAV